MQTHAEDIKAKVESFLDKTGMAPSAFGREAVNSGSLVSTLRAGRTPRPPMLAHIDAFIKEKEELMQRALTVTLEAIRSGDGYIQIDIAGEPVNLPRGVDYAAVKQLIASGQLQPGGDSFLGGRPQTYRPI